MNFFCLSVWLPIEYCRHICAFSTPKEPTILIGHEFWGQSIQDECPQTLGNCVLSINSEENAPKE